MKIEALNEEITAALRFLGGPGVSGEIKGAYSCHLEQLLKIKRDLIESDLKQSIENQCFDNLELIRSEAFKAAQSLIIDARDFDGTNTDPSELEVGDVVKIEGIWMGRGYAQVIDRSYSPASDCWILIVRFYSESEDFSVALDGIRVYKMESEQ